MVRSAHPTRLCRHRKMVRETHPTKGHSLEACATGYMMVGSAHPTFFHLRLLKAGCASLSRPT
jgi:hypothetical protein